jgi:GABA(A) receptor-associated protein
MFTKKSSSIESIPNKEQKDEVARLKAKYPDRIPCLVKKNGRDKTLPELDKSKFLTPEDLSFSQFSYVIRKRLKVPPEKALFFLVNGMMVPGSAILSQVYKEHQDENGFLLVIYSAESTFGA